MNGIFSITNDVLIGFADGLCDREYIASRLRRRTSEQIESIFAGHNPKGRELHDALRDVTQ